MMERSTHVHPTETVLAVLREALRPFADDSRDGATAALWLLQAELLGQPKFGIGMLARELDGLDGLEAHGTPASKPAAIDCSSTTTRLDAGGVPGVLELARAVRIAGDRAQELGSAVVAIQNVGATGMLGAAARQLADAGLIALVLAESAPIVAPWGGSAAAIGTNPIAIAVPRQEAPPLVIDFATAPTTIAAIRDAAERGALLPAGLALDHTGAPTADPTAVGALLPPARINSLTGLAVQLLAGVAVGGASTTIRDGLHAPRGAIVIAFLPPNREAAAAASGLAEAWARAGGHVPGRFDPLPRSLDGLPAELGMQAAAHEFLQSRGRTTPMTEQ